MIRRAEPIIKVAPVDARLDSMTIGELRALLSLIPGASVPAIARATETALRNAARSYLRMGKLTAAQVLTGVKA